MSWRRRSALTPLDQAFDYLRERGGAFAGLYAVAMTPFSVAALVAVDVVTSQDRSALGGACLLLALATLWRWAWLAVAQRRVQSDARAEGLPSVLGVLSFLLPLRLLVCAMLFWGGFLVLPGLFAFFLAGMLTPAALEYRGPRLRRFFGLVDLVHNSCEHLVKVVLALAVMLAFGLAGFAAAQAALAGLVLPKLLGLDVSDLLLTMGSYAWILCSAYFAFLAFDLYWSVASVMLFYELQARRLGSDLRLRLGLMREGA
jgi:hypothetical protein